MAAKNDFMIDEQSPASEATYPDSEDMSLVAAGHHRTDLSVGLLLHFGAGFVAESGCGEGTEDFHSSTSLSISVRPSKIRVEEFAD